MKLIDRTIKKEIKHLERTNSSFPRRYEYLRLDKNERLLPIKQKDLKAFKLSLSDDDITGYAELYTTYKKLAKFLKVGVNQLLIAAGADLAIKSVFETFVSAGNSIIVQSPSYAMTQVYAKMFGAKVKYFKVNSDLNAKLGEAYDLIDNKTKLIVIENPNGFVGNVFKIKEIQEFAKKLLKKKILLLIDEAYFYIEKNFFDKKYLLEKYPNVIIAQTFSKGHGLAGVRFGYLVGNHKIINFIKKVRPMHEISSLSAKAVEWVLNRPLMKKEFQKSIKESKNYLKQELSLMKIKYKMTTGNFFLIYAPNYGKTKNLSKKLEQKKILIRRPFEQKNIRGWVRICVGSLLDSKKLISALKKIIKIKDD